MPPKSRFLGKVNKNAQSQKAKSSSFGYLHVPKDIPFFKEEPGARMTLDILPYIVKDPNHPDRDDESEIAVPDSYWYKRPFRTHRSIGVDNTTVICPTSIGKKCPICDYRARLLKEGMNWKDESVRALKPTDRNLYYVVPIGHSKYKEVPHIWEISQFLFQEALNDELEENADNGCFPELSGGKSLRIRFSEETFDGNKYAKTSRIDFEDRDYEYPEDLVEKLPSLDSMIDIKPYETLERLFLQTGSSQETPHEVDKPEAYQEEETQSIRRRKTTSPDTQEATPENRRSALRTPQHEEEAPPENETPRTRREPRPTETKAPSSEQSKPTADAPPARQRAPAKKGPSCPAGHQFGQDADDYPECAKCEIWEACMEMRETAEANH